MICETLLSSYVWGYMYIASTLWIPRKHMTITDQMYLQYIQLYRAHIFWDPLSYGQTCILLLPYLVQGMVSYPIEHIIIQGTYIIFSFHLSFGQYLDFFHLVAI